MPLLPDRLSLFIVAQIVFYQQLGFVNILITDHFLAECKIIVETGHIFGKLKTTEKRDLKISGLDLAEILSLPKIFSQVPETGKNKTDIMALAIGYVQTYL